MKKRKRKKKERKNKPRCLSAMARPTAFEMPCPKGPVDTSMPGVMKFSGWPGVLEPSCRKDLRSSRERSKPQRWSMLDGEKEGVGRGYASIKEHVEDGRGPVAAGKKQANQYWRAQACPLDRTNRSLPAQVGLEGLKLITFWKST